MKKFMATILSVLMVFAMAVTSFAASDNFVSSPSGNTAPTLVSFSNSSENCKAELIITAYKDRNTLSSDKQAEIEEAYNKIINSSDLAVLCSGLKDIASKNSIEVADLAVSDLFDISYYEDGGHDGHGTFTITLSAETLNNFVALVHCVGSDWEVIENASVDSTGTKLTFTIDEFSPFAIVVNNQNSQSAPTSAQTSSSVHYGYIAAAIVLACAAVCLFVFGKKKKSAKA